MKPLHRWSVADRVWDTLSSIAGGSWFAAFHVIWFAAWIAVNRGYVRGIKPFDPYPFNLLTMIVSLEVIFVTIAVLNSQNRMTRLADRRTTSIFKSTCSPRRTRPQPSGCSARSRSI